MLLFAQIDLSTADLPLFEAYEARVLALLGHYGARLEARLRSADGQSEVHLLDFPDAQALEAYRNDPVRIAAQPMWQACGAVAQSMEVVRIA